MLIKTTRRLFRGTYQYKLVLICAGASLFRSGDMDTTLKHLRSIRLDTQQKTGTSWRPALIKTQDELDYAFKLSAALSTMKELDIRVESPWISIYTNNKADIDTLTGMSEANVKYVSVPPDTGTLATDTIIMPKMDFDYRVTLGKTNQEYSAFIDWAIANKKCKLTKSCITALEKHRSWGGTHFYVTGDNNLLMARMHLNGSISKVERIIKA